jgi:hypothetical protein
MVRTLAADQADWEIRLAQADAAFLEIAFAFDHREIHLLAALDVGDDWVERRGCHVQGSGPNTVSVGGLKALANWVMENFAVEEVRIFGAARTSGARPGPRPHPYIFRRTRRGCSSP